MVKEVVLLIKQMSGGGAERVVSMLASQLKKGGYSATVILTHQKLQDADLSRLSEKVCVISLPDELEKGSSSEKKGSIKTHKSCIKAVAKFERFFLPKGKARQLIKMYKLRNYDKYCWLRAFFAEHQGSTLIAFLYDSIFLTLLAADKTNKVIISDRGDPEQSVSSRTDMAFFDLMFKKADHMVFQSPDVRQWYRDRFGLTGTIIFNPIKPDLPNPYIGERKKKIVNFCRISSQKNLHLLVNAFDIFYQTHTDYELYIIGDAVGNGIEGYMESVEALISQKDSKDKIYIQPAMHSIHTEILDYDMFVSSSDFEGMSNSMLEAMAIGLPTICTDCPAGGARAVIRDHENGILTPVGDADAMAKAMAEVADDPDLAQKLSQNGVKIRKTQSVDKIINQWMELLY